MHITVHTVLHATTLHYSKASLAQKTNEHADSSLTRDCRQSSSMMSCVGRGVKEAPSAHHPVGAQSTVLYFDYRVFMV